MSTVDQSTQITLRTLITARWVLLGLLAGTGVLVTLVPGLAGPWLLWFPAPSERLACCITLGVWSIANIVTQQRYLRGGRATRRVAGIHLLVDATVLTVLLSLSGGPTNPFTTVYFVPITLATQVSPRWTWALAGYCLAGFAALFVLQPLPLAPTGQAAHFSGHMRGMWVAFAVTGGLVTYFVHRIALSLAQQRDELLRLREERIRDRHLAALGTLAAGAAHEIGTPLGSIHLFAGELPHMQPEEQAQAIASIQQEVARCKDILQHMASPEMSVQSFGAQGGEPWPLSSLAEHARRVAANGDVELRVELDAEVEVRQPRGALEQIVRELVANAVDACRRREDGRGGITLGLRTRDDDIVVEVRDEGVGMDPEMASHAFEPFYSTKAEGEGMGLGLYLARAHLQQLGGQLELDTELGRGTALRMIIPNQPASTRGGASPRRI